MQDRHSDSYITQLLSHLSLQEKCSLLSGSDFWHTKAIERLEIPSIMVSDGPHGLRKQEETAGSGVNDSIEAVCFPAACASASSFSKEVYQVLGETIGDECQAQNVSTILGPAINIKRSPLCGRNFEYISEDPFLAGELAAAYINGVQSKKVGTSLKHFALNNQEYRRLTNSSDCDERTMREIYLAAFETAVKKAQPKTIMHSYNLINGTYAGESAWLLTEVLRKEWGFLGLVMSDWGAVDNRVAGLEAGTDLEMPSSDGINDQKVFLAAQKNPALIKKIDESCRRILRWVFDFADNRQSGSFDMPAHHRIAQHIEEESIVLLKNDGNPNVLPLNKEHALLVIGEFAQKPRFQGGGSSHIRTTHVSSFISVLEAQKIPYTYKQGFAAEPATLPADLCERLKNEALQAARTTAVDVIAVFAGLPESFESEGYDRTHIRLPQEQNDLIEALTQLGKKVVVVLHNGSAVELPWAQSVDAIVETYLGGEAVGEATARVLFGEVNPSGKLPETFPLKLSDTPSYLSFAKDKMHTPYTEGIFVGYRWYQARNWPVLFPFGHGLSYTTFSYDHIQVSKTDFSDTEEIIVTVTIRNTGAFDGKEIVQLYVSDKTNATQRPPQELKGFEKVFIPQGKSASVTFTLNKRSFAWYNTDIGDWYAASGTYHILVGASSQDIRLTQEVHLTTSVKLPIKLWQNTSVGDLLADERTAPFVRSVLETTKSTIDTGNENAAEAISPEMQIQMQDSNPLRNLYLWNHVPSEQFDALMKNLQDALQNHYASQ